MPSLLLSVEVEGVGKGWPRGCPAAPCVLLSRMRLLPPALPCVLLSRTRLLPPTLPSHWALPGPRMERLPCSEASMYCLMLVPISCSAPWDFCRRTLPPSPVPLLARPLGVPAPAPQPPSAPARKLTEASPSW